MTQLSIKVGDTHITIDAAARLTINPKHHEPVSLEAHRAAVAESMLAAGHRFTRVLGDGTYLQADSPRTDHVAVIDNTTGLMWSVESLGDPADEDDGITQEHCIERCRQLRLLGHDDWRLPTRAELAGLVDDTRHEPAIDTTAFPRVKARWHWTSTPAAWCSSAAWGVVFNGGGVLGYRRSSDGFALAVRRSGQ
ncbi:DUF1566 domain-containing protein [Luteimonas sp. JM171]|uniref:Lcl C-terminal domain-containing protein n=1 Tax=Luteimonas sp. JM171 TaxID=1896164 RepID=UPI0008566B7E|nr:DUF1566 domain-containing protein [Luteimonas sp. JM171]AOH36854.1 hypothetical protein BGP89_11235 [Luteimonas sp. JM171]